MAGTLALGACTSNGADDAGDDSAEGSTSSASTLQVTSSTSAPAGGDDELSIVSTSDFTDGPLVGGSIERSYPGTTYPSELTGIVQLAIDDLAAFLDVDGGTINVVGVEEVIWSNAGLGCPEPGMAYAQVVTDGLRIILESGGAVHDYRSGGLGEPRRCDTALAVTEKTTTTTLSLDTDGSVTTVTASTGQSITVRTEPEEGEKPTEGINPPDE